MLDKASESAEKCSDAEADNNGDDDPDVRVKVGSRGVGEHR
jgi:hypothetical protein